MYTYKFRNKRKTKRAAFGVRFNANVYLISFSRRLEKRRDVSDTKVEKKNYRDVSLCARALYKLIVLIH